MKLQLFASSIFLLAFSTLSACSGGGGGDGTGSISGRVDFVAQSAIAFDDSAPDDSVDQPHALGSIEPGARVVVRGEVGPDDALDAFAFDAPQRVSVTATLVYDADPSRELQLGVFDPVAMRVVARGERGVDSTGRPRDRARVTARGAFDVVVRAARGAGAYSLSLRASRATDRVSQPGWIGDLGVGEQVTIESTGQGRWTATSLEAQSLRVSVPAGRSVRVRDAANGLDELVVGERSLELVALQHLELTVDDAGDGPFAFRLAGTEATAPVAQRARARVVRLEAERAEWNAAPDAALYGRVALESVPGELLVRARGSALLTREYEGRSCRVKDFVPGIADVVEIDLAPTVDALEAARATVATSRSLAASPRVEYAELNLIRRPLGGPVNPNDTFYGLQWHYPLIRLPEAWGAMTGTATSIVAVIDTGSRPHTDLNANLITGYDFISSATIADDGDGRDADPFDEGDGQGPTPSSFHGTHVAGTIAAVTNNSSGVAGVCGPGNHTKVMHLRVLGKGGGTDSDIAQAILYAARLANASGTLPATRADVINLSLGGPGSTSTVQSAVNAAFAAGVTIFAAAGNNNSGTAFFPASYNNVVSVSAVDINSVKAPYSNFNATVDLCAPGGDSSVDLNADTYPDGVLSTLVAEATGNPNFVFYQGTSMACPHAAGLAALMHTQNSALTPTQIETQLKNTAVDLGTVGQDPIYGVGLVNAYQAVLAAAGTGGGPPVLATSPSTLAFGATTTQLSIQIVNLGGGTLDVGTVADDAPWLTLTEIASSGSGSDVGSIRCNVDRTGLTAGDYLATVTVSANNGTVPTTTVSVTMTVEPTPVVVDVELFVLAVDAATFDTVQQAVINPTTGLDYTLADLPPGEYVILCGSDEDLTDGICGPNDIYCGLYPTVNDPEIVTLGEEDVGGYDFVVAPTGSGGVSVGGPHRTYRKLPH